MVASSLANSKFDDTVGAAFIGFAASCVVYGALSTQVYNYYDRYRNDRAIYKFMAAALWILSTVDQCLIGHAVYYYAISNYGNPASLVGKPIWSLMVQVIFGSVIGAAVKGAFAIRVWRFSCYNYLLVGILLLLTFAQLCLATVYTVRAFALDTFLDLPKLKTIASLSLGAGVLTDITTASALCFYLQKLRTGHSKSDSLVRSLTRYAVNCGVITTAFSLATLVTFDILPDTFVFMSFYFVSSKLYGVSFLATLNTRTIIRGRGTDNEDPGRAGSTFIMYGQSALRPQGDMPHGTDSMHLKIDVQKETTVSSTHGYTSGW